MSKSDDKDSTSKKNNSEFRIVMTPEKIRQTLIKNCTKMLMARNELKGYDLYKSQADSKKLETYYNKLYSRGNDDYVYTITGTTINIPQKNNEDQGEEEGQNFKKFAIKIYPDDLNSVNVISIKDFMKKYSDYHKILIVRSATQNA